MSRSLRAAGAGLAIALALASAAQAQMRNVGPGVADRTNTVTRGGGDDIIFGGELQTSLDLDVNGRRRQQGSYGNLFTESLLGGYLLLPHGFAINGVLRLEQNGQPSDGRGGIFRNQMLWADELYLTWSHGTLDLFGGKIHPRFGSAWDRGPGVYGTDFGREYELTEKLGAGARLWFSDLLGFSRWVGTHNLQAEFFEADRSVLSSSALAPRWVQQQTSVDPNTGEAMTTARLRWRNRTATGGPDNTAFMGGSVVSMAGYGIPMPRGMAGYTLSWSHRRPGQDATLAGRGASEQGGSAGAFWTIPLPQRLTAAPFVEYAVRDRANGFTGRRSDWLTAGFDLRRAPWTLSYAFLGNHNRDRVEQVRAGRTGQTASVSYDLYFVAPHPLLRSASVTLGWRRVRESGVSANDFGALVGWTYKF